METLINQGEHKWTLDMTCFYKIRIDRHPRICGAAYKWQIPVTATGQVVLVEKDRPLLMHAPMGKLAERLKWIQEREPGHYIEEVEIARDVMFPFLHTTLLTFSFLHCKNVTLSPTT